MIKRRAIFRLAVLERDKCFSFSPTVIPPGALKASNLKLHISLGLLSDPDAVEIFNHFGHLHPLINQTAARKSCQVTIKCTAGDTTDGPRCNPNAVNFPMEVVRALRSFAGFEIVTTEIEYYNSMHGPLAPAPSTAAYCGLIARTKN